MARLNQSSLGRSKDIVDNFKKYLLSISEIPTNSNGEPNRTAMAQASGFDRKRFSTNPKLNILLDEALKKFPLSKGKKDFTSADDKTTAELKRENNRLQSRVVELQNELHHTKIENRKAIERAAFLEQQVSLCGFDQEMLLDTGRMPRDE